MLSRRDLLARLLQAAPFAGGAGLACTLGPEGWESATSVGALRAAPSAVGPVPDRLAQSASALAATAPRARYWAAAGSSDCRACHPGSGKLQAHTHAKGVVQCLLCAQACVIEEGKRGRCRTRVNAGGELRSLVYGRPITTQVDPIEKKPFFHFLPGSSTYSIATSGCPLRCTFCQNWQISQAAPEDYDAPFTPPTRVAAGARDRRAPVIAYTYNEPTVFTEYLTDIAREGRKLGLRSVAVSCGFMNEAPLAEMCQALDAIKIDLKGFSEEFYRTVCGAELRPVLRSIRQVARSKTHLEIVNLVVPTLNDSDASLRELVAWVAGEVGPDVPIHFTRFHPDYQLRNLPPTPLATLERARDIALSKGLRYAYVGNVPGHPGNNTACPSCGKIVVERDGMFVTAIHVENGRCAFCKGAIAGVWG